jgi:RNA polymerase sigma-70 factor (ECF subfamily)
VALKAGDTQPLTLRHSLDEPDVRHGLRQLAQGDAEAFWELWAIHQQQIFTICLRYMGHARADAEDALSQVREKARHTLSRAAWDVRDPRAWLARVAVNQCIDIQRDQQRHHCRIVHLDAEEAGDVSAAVACGALPDHSLILSELKAAVERAIRALPARMRAASVLYFLEERSHQEIAADLNISYANARKRIQEARTILRMSVDFRSHLTFFEIPP